MQRYYSQYNPHQLSNYILYRTKKNYPKIHMETNDHD